MRKNLALILIICFSFLVSAQKDNPTKKLLDDLQKSETDSSRILLYLKLGNHSFQKNTDSSFFYYEKAKKLSQQFGFKELEAKTLYRIAKNYELLNKYLTSIEYYNESLEIYGGLNIKSKEALINNNLGYNYANLFAENKSLEYYLKSLNTYTEIKDDDGIAMNLNDIGNLYFDFENYESANKYFYDALEIYRKLDNKEGISVCYTNIGNSISESGNDKEGLKFYYKSVDFQKEIGNQLGIAVNFNNIGDSYIQLKQYSKALNYFTDALEIAKREKDKELLSLIYLNMSEVYNKINNYKEAIKNANLSNEIAREIGKIDYIVDNLKHLADAYEVKRDFEKSYFYNKEYIKLKDSLFKNDKQKKVLFFNALIDLEEKQYKINSLQESNAIAELRYENEKKLTFLLIMNVLLFAILIIIMIFQQTAKQKAFNLLKYKNHQIKQLNNEAQMQKNDLELLNNTKDKFFSIIAHDLKNPFNSIKGFTELLIDNEEVYTGEKRVRFLKIIKGSTDKASNLLDNLLTWANSQTGSLEFKPEKIEVVKLVTDVVSLVEIQAINKGVAIFNNVHHNLFVLADKNMLSTVFRNLISNAIKFSNTNSQILISSSFDANFIYVAVRDEGVGMDNLTIEKLFNIEYKISNVGTKNEQGSGLGLILCKDFIEKNGGKIWVKSIIGHGSTFNFTIPIYKDV